MLPKPRFFSGKFKYFLILLLTAGLNGLSQPVTPTPGQIADMLPPGINPAGMSSAELDALLKDSKPAAGKPASDLNKAIPAAKKTGIDGSDTLKPRSYYPLKERTDATYGADVFSNAAITDVTELSTPPSDYPIGVGDHIIVSLWGGGEFQEDYVVARDGTIFPSRIGKISVQGLSFENAQQIIRSKFAARAPGGTKIQVTMGQPRSININVVGEVNNPGPKTISAFGNAFAAIGLAGGMTPNGNLREIAIKRDGKVMETVDLYQYLLNGEMGRKVYLQNNDFVVVGFYNKKVMATGQFKRPMYYQLRKEEGLQELIRYAGGFTPEALTSTVSIIGTENEKQLIRSVGASPSSPQVPLRDGDVVRADLIRPGIINKVELQGAITYPGIYEIRKDDRLFDLINRAGGLTAGTYLYRAYVFRNAGDTANFKTQKIEVNLAELERQGPTGSQNISLAPNDIIRLLHKSEFGEQQFVSIDGEVRREGKMTLHGGMTLQDLILLSGGLKPSAEYGRLEISSITDTDSAQLGIKPTKTIVRSYAINANLELDAIASGVLLKPYDEVHVRRNPEFEMQENITLQGQVKYPGTYARLDKTEKLSSFIERAGGLRENANAGGVLLFRKKSDYNRDNFMPPSDMDSLELVRLKKQYNTTDEPVSIDLYRALRYRDSRHNVILQKGDVLMIPETDPFVKVRGRVQSPLKITFDSKSKRLPYYIDKAGGFGVRPWRNRIYVTYANGKSRRTKNIFFLHFYPRVEEGCTITVPERPENKEFGNVAKQVLLSAIPVFITYLLLKN
jgi:protein involved in polysaccharide export with SLBB domain